MGKASKSHGIDPSGNGNSLIEDQISDPGGNKSNGIDTSTCQPK